MDVDYNTIISQSDNISSRIPNIISLDWKAKENQIILSITNLGIDTVDIVAGTINTGNTIKSFSVPKVKVGTTNYTVNVDMKTCTENIIIDFYGLDGKTEFGNGTSKGHRQIPASLVSYWHKGTFISVEDSIDYHYRTHGNQIGSTNICSYVRSAKSFQTNLSGATSSPVNGITPNVTRWKKNGKYIDIYGSKNTGLIISYGKQ